MSQRKKKQVQAFSGSWNSCSCHAGQGLFEHVNKLSVFVFARYRLRGENVRLPQNAAQRCRLLFHDTSQWLLQPNISRSPNELRQTVTTKRLPLFSAVCVTCDWRHARCENHPHTLTWLCLAQTMVNNFVEVRTCSCKHWDGTGGSTGCWAGASVEQRSSCRDFNTGLVCFDGHMVWRLISKKCSYVWKKKAVVSISCARARVNCIVDEPIPEIYVLQRSTTFAYCLSVYIGFCVCCTLILIV